MKKDLQGKGFHTGGVAGSSLISIVPDSKRRHVDYKLIIKSIGFTIKWIPSITELVNQPSLQTQEHLSE